MAAQTLPEWLKQTQPIALPRCKKMWLHMDYLEKTLTDINGMMAEDAYSSTISKYHGVLQRIDPHVKLIGILALIISTSVAKNIAVLISMNIVIFLAALQSGIRCNAYLIRVWVPTFLFAGIAVLPGIINWITPGESLYTIYTGLHWQVGSFALPADLVITVQGVKSAVFVVLRAAASLGLATLLIKTTRWSLLTKALAKFGLPAGIVTVFDLTYRYIYMFLLILAEYLLGRRSRLVGRETQSTKISWIGGTIAGFLRMVWEYGQEVNHAMQSRGYYGEYHAEAHYKIGRIEIGFLVVVMAICYCAWGDVYVRIFNL